jgi:hypothetical protein
MCPFCAIALVAVINACDRGETGKKWTIPDSAPVTVAATAPSESTSVDPVPSDVPRLAATGSESRAAVYGGPPSRLDQRQTVELQMQLLAALSSDAGNISDLSAAPRGQASVGALVVSGQLPDAERRVAGLRPGLRNCFNKGLVNDPSMSGTLVIEIQVSPSGDVTNVSRVGGAGLSPAVEQCIMQRAKNMSFEAGVGGKVHVPLSFVHAT